MLEMYPRASEELAWRFLGADALLGMHGQAIDGIRSGSFDAASCERMHLARNSFEHRNAVVKRTEIDRTLERVGWGERATIVRTFEPFGRATFILAACFTVGRASLVQVAVHTKAAREAYERARGEEAGSGWTMLEWLEQTARTLGRTEADAIRLRSKKPSGHVFERILTECQRTVTTALGEYDTLRAERVAIAKTEREAFYEAERKKLHEKLWGTP